MANGVFLFKDSGNRNFEVISKYFIGDLESEFDLSTEILNKIAKKHLIYIGSSRSKRILSYRTENVKFFSIFLGSLDAEGNIEEKSIFLNFILDLAESVEPFSIMIQDMKNTILSNLEEGSSALDEVLKLILDNRNQLVDDVQDPKRITERLVTKANKLLDDEEFEKAQKLIKRAKEIPPKIASLVKRGNDAFDAKDLKSAQKSYNEAAGLAQKINQNAMYQLLVKKANRAREIPKFNKNWIQLYDHLSKLLKKMDKRESAFYLEPINRVNKAIEISDMLEDDDTITDLQILEDLLQKGDEMSKDLDDVDSDIKDLLKKLKRD